MPAGAGLATGRFSDAEIADARSRLDLIAADVPLKRRGNELVGLCPFHNEKTPSFCVVPHKNLFHCFGCGAHGDAIAYVMRTRNLGFVEAVGDILGRTTAKPREYRALERGPRAPVDDSRMVREIIEASRPLAPGSAAWLYLQTRAIDPRPVVGLYEADAIYCSETRSTFPALIAPIQSSAGVMTALQRIWCVRRVEYVAGEGPRDARAPLDVRKKTLGTIGDGAVRLGRAPKTQLGIAEGVETALAASQLLGFPVWALCGVHRMGFPSHWREDNGAGNRPTISFQTRPPSERARRVEERAPSFFIEDCPRRLVICADRGEIGETCAGYCAWFLRKRGVSATVIFPDGDHADFNDQLISEKSLAP